MSPIAVAENVGPTRISVCVTLVPSVVTSVLTSRSSDNAELAKRMVGTLSAASLAAKSSAIFSSSGTSIGSRRTGVIQVPVTGLTGASSTRCRRTMRAARDMATASAAARCAPSRVIVLVAANPQLPSTSVRTPNPYDSLSLTPVTWRSRVEIDWRR